MLWRWPISSDSLISIGSQASFLFPRFAASLVTPERWLSLFSAVEKNSLWSVWSRSFHLLRQAATLGPRSLLWRQTRLPRLPHSQGPVRPVWHREKRGVGLACRQPVLHPALRFLRGPTLPRDHGQGGGGRSVPGLACGQGTRQAVHGRTSASDRMSCSPGHRHRRDRHCQGAQVPHRGQRPGASAADLVRRPGPFRSEPGRVFRLAGPEKVPENTLGGHGYVACLPQLHPQGRERTPGQLSSTTSFIFSGI
jgi:hypothetical protein